MTSWTAVVEWLGEDLTDDQTDTVMDTLAGVHASIGALEPGRLSAIITVQASTLAEACTTALNAVTTAVQGAGLHFIPAGLQVLETDTFDARELVAPVPDLVGISEIATAAGVTRQRAAQLAAIDGFPAPVVTTASGPLRRRAAVEAWLKSRSAQQRPGPRPRSARAT